MPPAPLVWKCGCEVAKWQGVSELRLPSGEVAMCTGESATQEAPGGGARRLPGGSGGSKIAPGGWEASEAQKSLVAGSQGAPEGQKSPLAQKNAEALQEAVGAENSPK